jgi:uncharacterized protein (DUF433 family)
MVKRPAASVELPMLGTTIGPLGISMKHEELLSRITVDPDVCHGKPCIRGHRIWVSLVLDLLADGMTTEQVLDDYPGLEADDVRACVAYGAEMARERVVVTGKGAA